MKINAKVIKDSVSPTGIRLTTIEATMHRFVLAEFNTHRVFSRNSASSRAIPVEKTLANVSGSPALPLVWACEQPGMQGGTELEGFDLEDAQRLFEDVHSYTIDKIASYLIMHPEKSSRLHKSLINRLLEPFMYQVVVVTSTEWEGFFEQRCHPDAQPEIRAVANAMRDAYNKSLPSIVHIGEWHLPYIDIEDMREAEKAQFELNMSVQNILQRQSVARCARVSTLAHDGKKSIEADLNLFNRLVTAKPPHASPLEHVATPASWYVVKENDTLGNFNGWHQLRHRILSA